MAFPRHADNSLNFTAYDLLDRPAQKEAALELKQNGTPAEHKQAGEYFSKKLAETKILHAQELENGKRREAAAQATLDKTVSKISTAVTDDLLPNQKKNKCSIS